MDPTETQCCNKCREDKPLSEYYLIDGYKHFKRCKECVKAARPKKPKVRGWLALPEETRAAIVKDLQDRRMKIKEVAEAHGVNYPNLCWYIRSGQTSSL